MRSRLRQIPQLLRTPVGRRRLLRGALARFDRLILPLARWYRRTALRRTRVVAVVGSFGKTTTARAVKAALGIRDFSQASNTRVGIALALCRMRPWHRFGVIEVGIGRPGEMSPYADLVRPDIVVVTCVGTEHLSSMKSLDVTRHEKAEMVRALPAAGVAILNGDDPNVLWMAGETQARVVTFGFRETNDVWASESWLDWPRGMVVRLRIGSWTADLHTGLVGRHSLLSLVAAAAVAESQGLPLEDVAARLERVSPAQNRLQVIPHASGATLLLDAVKSAIETVNAALDTLADIPARRKIAVLGDVEEPPESQGPLYKALGQRVGAVCDRVIFLGAKKAHRSLAAGFAASGRLRGDAIHLRDGVGEAARVLGKELRSGDVVLIKGRSTQHLERLALALTGTTLRCGVRLCRLRRDCSDCPEVGRAPTAPSRSKRWRRRAIRR